MRSRQRDESAPAARRPSSARALGSQARAWQIVPTSEAVQQAAIVGCRMIRSASNKRKTRLVEDRSRRARVACTERGTRSYFECPSEANAKAHPLHFFEAAQ